MTNADMHINHKIYRPIVLVNIIKVVMYFRWVVIICTLLNIQQFMKSCYLSTVCVSILLGTSSTSIFHSLHKHRYVYMYVYLSPA
jgi:hypothetical protein